MNDLERRAYYRDLGTRLKASRTASGIDPRVVARRLGVTRTAVYNWEAGRSKVPFDVIVALAEIYGVKLDDLR